MVEIAWPKILETTAKFAPYIFKKLQPSDRDKAIKKSIELFIEVFTEELRDSIPLSVAIEPYLAQLKQFIEGKAAHEIAAHMHPERRGIDPAPFRRMWDGMNLPALPEDFNWPLVAGNFERAIRRHLKEDPILREALSTALLERAAGPDPGFDLPGYRRYLQTKCGQVQLGAIHTKAYERRIALWSVFIPQEARESAPIPNLPSDPQSAELEELRHRFQAASTCPVLDILERHPHTVILGDPGAGKTSLLKYLAMRWVNEDGPTLPIWIDLREYASHRNGFLKFCDSHCATYGLNFVALEQRLHGSTAALYLDGLDEIFDLPARASVIEEASAFAARYPRIPIVVTSRKLGYDPERLTNAGFTHATLEDFDDARIHRFLTQWHEAAEESPSERTRLHERIARALRESRSIRDLAGNPLLLTMMAILNANQELPRDRVELYQHASRVLLHDWDASKTLSPDIFARQEKEELLRELAGAMQQEPSGLAGNLIGRKRLLEVFRTYLERLGIEDWYAKANALVEQLTARNFILCHYGANHFGFVHRTFLEYFCATWFYDQELTTEQLKEIYGAHWQDEKWHEVLRLIAGMLKPDKAEAIIHFLMEQDGQEHKYENMMLAAGCLSEVRKRHEIQETDAKLLLLFRSQLIRWQPFYGTYPSQVLRESYRTREKAMHCISNAWRSEETRLWLQGAGADDPDWFVRQSAVWQLAAGWTDHPDTRPFLIERARIDEASEVRGTLFILLVYGWKDHPDTRQFFFDRAHNDENAEVRALVFGWLGRGWKDHPDTRPFFFDHARSDASPIVRKLVITDLLREWKDHPDTRALLLDRAQNDLHWYVRKGIARELALGWKDNSFTRSLLIRIAVKDESADVRRAATEELTRLWPNDPEVIALLPNEP